MLTTIQSSSPGVPCPSPSSWFLVGCLSAAQWFLQPGYENFVGHKHKKHLIFVAGFCMAFLKPFLAIRLLILISNVSLFYSWCPHVCFPMLFSTSFIGLSSLFYPLGFILKHSVRWGYKFSFVQKVTKLLLYPSLYSILQSQSFAVAVLSYVQCPFTCCSAVRLSVLLSITVLIIHHLPYSFTVI